MMFNYPREDGEEENKMDTDDDGIEIDSLADAMFLTSSRHNTSATNIPQQQKRDENENENENDDDERKRIEQEKFAWALEASHGLSAAANASNAAAAASKYMNGNKKTSSSLSLKSSHQHQRVQPGVSKHVHSSSQLHHHHHHHHHHHTTVETTAGTSKVDQVIKSILKTSRNDDENNKPPPPSTPSINVQEQAARTLRDRRGALRVVEMFMSLEKFDSENQLAASTASVLTQSEYKDACEERSLIGKCG